MPTIVQRVSNAYAQGTRWRATPNAHPEKDQTFKIPEKREQRTSPGWLTFTPVNWISFTALQTPGRAHGTAILFGPYGSELQNLMLRFIAANDANLP